MPSNSARFSATTKGAIPFTVVIGKDGKLAHTFKGDIPNADLEKIIDPLIG